MSAVRVDVERTAIRLSQVLVCRVIGNLNPHGRLARLSGIEVHQPRIKAAFYGLPKRGPASRIAR
jgi:hypothetical protein